MKEAVYKLKSKVWLYPGMAGWHFIIVDKKLSAKIKERYAKRRRGFGSLPVEVKLGKSIWKTSIFPSREGVYLLPLKAKIRKAEEIEADDIVTFTIKLRV